MKVYLDYNATTPVDERVLDEMLPFFKEQFGNAASATHVFGWEAKAAVDQARERIAGLINAEPDEIVFTSGATEAVNLAIKGAFERFEGYGNHIITVRTEHKAVLDVCQYLESKGAEVTYLGVDKEGLIDPEELRKAITDKTILITVMYANNETGVIQPVKEISAIARQHKIWFFTDATQAVGKIPVDVTEDGIDMLAMSAHKMYGPKGAGALYTRRKNPRVSLIPLIHGGGHERGFRSGTLNVPGIAGFGKAAEICQKEMGEERRRIKLLRDRLEIALTGTEGVSVNGSVSIRLPNVSNLSFAGRSANDIIKGIYHEIAVSTGSACTSAIPEPSHVLKAMDLPDELSFTSIRFSLGRFTTKEEIEYVTGRFLNLAAGN